MTASALAIDVTAHVKLVHWVIKRHGSAACAGSALDLNDLIQEGMAGLLRAAQTFDPTRGTFSTYAVPWIRQCIGRHIQDRGCVVRVPVYLQARRYQAGERTTPRIRPLDAPLRSDTDTTLGDLLSTGDVLGGEPSPDPDAAIDRASAASRLAALYDRARLTPRERLVLRLRTQVNELTLTQVGERIGVTRERVRQVEANALRKLGLAAGVSIDGPRSLGAARRAARSKTKPKMRRKPNGPKGEP